MLSKIDSLTFPISDEARRIYRMRDLIGKAVGSSKLYGALVRIRRPLDRLIQLGDRYRANKRYAALLRGNARHDETGYEGDKEVRAFMQYKHELASSKFERIRSPSPSLYREQELILREMLAADPEIRSVINFGVSYGHIDALLAKAFPQIQFHGIDRSPYTKALNEVEFAGIGNLHFHAADIFDFLSREAERAVLFHSRTMTLLPQDAVGDVYRAARKAGCIAVAGFEPIGICRDTGRPYEFSTECRRSEHHRHYMHIHNYPWMLKMAGFGLTHFDAIETNSPHKDQRMLCFTAIAN